MRRPRALCRVAPPTDAAPSSSPSCWFRILYWWRLDRCVIRWKMKLPLRIFLSPTGNYASKNAHKVARDLSSTARSIVSSKRASSSLLSGCLCSLRHICQAPRPTRARRYVLPRDGYAHCLLGSPRANWCVTHGCYALCSGSSSHLLLTRALRTPVRSTNHRARDRLGLPVPERSTVRAASQGVVRM